MASTDKLSSIDKTFGRYMPCLCITSGFICMSPQVNLAQYDTVIIFGVNEMVCTVLEILLLTYTLCYPVDASARGEAHCKH